MYSIKKFRNCILIMGILEGASSHNIEPIYLLANPAAGVTNLKMGGCAIRSSFSRVIMNSLQYSVAIWS